MKFKSLLFIVPILALVFLVNGCAEYDKLTGSTATTASATTTLNDALKDLAAGVQSVATPLLGELTGGNTQNGQDVSTALFQAAATAGNAFFAQLVTLYGGTTLAPIANYLSTALESGSFSTPAALQAAEYTAAGVLQNLTNSQAIALNTAAPSPSATPAVSGTTGSIESVRHFRTADADLMNGIHWNPALECGWTMNYARTEDTLSGVTNEDATYERTLGESASVPGVRTVCNFPAQINFSASDNRTFETSGNTLSGSIMQQCHRNGDAKSQRVAVTRSSGARSQAGSKWATAKTRPWPAQISCITNDHEPSFVLPPFYVRVEARG